MPKKAKSEVEQLREEVESLRAEVAYLHASMRRDSSLPLAQRWSWAEGEPLVYKEVA